MIVNTIPDVVDIVAYEHSIKRPMCDEDIITAHFPPKLRILRNP